MTAARAVVVGLVALLGVAACGAGGLTDDERLWCAEHYPVVIDTMDVLFPFHWKGNEEYKAEVQPLFQQVRDGVLSEREANLRMAELALEYWPAEYLEGCRAAYAGR